MKLSEGKCGQEEEKRLEHGAHSILALCEAVKNADLALIVVDEAILQMLARDHGLTIPGLDPLPGDDEAQACRIEFDLRYAFANPALEALVSPVFDRIANTLVDSFVQRAEQVHGPR